MKRRLIASNLLAAFLVISATPSPTGQYATYRGTIGAVDAKANAFDLTTGVGMALRVVRIQLSSDTRVQEGTRRARISDLAPGDVVRADCRRAGAATVAERIEILVRR